MKITHVNLNELVAVIMIIVFMAWGEIDWRWGAIALAYMSKISIKFR